MNLLAQFFEKYTVIVTVGGDLFEARSLSDPMSRGKAEKVLEELESGRQTGRTRWWDSFDRSFTVVPYLGEEHSIAIKNDENSSKFDKLMNSLCKRNAQKLVPTDTEAIHTALQDYANLLEFNPDLMVRGEDGSLHPTDRWLEMCREALKRTEWLLNISPSEEEEYQTAMGLRESLTKILGDRQ